jgi:hypothetical protein
MLPAAADAIPSAEEHATILPSSSGHLLHALKTALASSTFMPDGGLVGFACQVI